MGDWIAPHMDWTETSGTYESVEEALKYAVEYVVEADELKREDKEVKS